MIEKQFNLQLSDLQKLPRRNVDGKRLYETPDGSFYPSVTTITGQMTKKAIQEWRARVGEKEANRVTKKASSRGTSIHKLCEHYILNNMREMSMYLTISIFSGHHECQKPGVILFWRNGT